jgi:hypothetical protein
MNTILQELVRRARVRGATGGSDKQLAQYLLRSYAACPHCGGALGWNPRRAILRVRSAEEFIFRFGRALSAHQKDHPACDEGLKGMLTPEEEDIIRERVQGYTDQHPEWRRRAEAEGD